MTKFVFLPPYNAYTKELRDQFAKQISDSFPDLLVETPENDADVLESIKDADAAMGWITPEALKIAQKIKWLHNPDAGPFEGYYYDELVKHPLIMTNPRGIYSDHIGNHIMTYLLALSKRFPDFFEAQRRKEWNQNANRHEVIHLNQATVMIVGAGGIGQEVGRLCKAFNMEVIGVDPKFDQLENFDEVIKPEQLYDFLGNIDVLVSTVMHTPETQNLFNLKLFKKMKPTSIFINIGRGKTTSLDDLVNALENNIISGAGLDVFEEEPLPKNHKLWNLPGVIITPHVALLDADGIINNRRYEIIQKNIILFNEGKELHNIVDKEKWY